MDRDDRQATREELEVALRTIRDRSQLAADNLKDGTATTGLTALRDIYMEADSVLGENTGFRERER